MSDKPFIRDPDEQDHHDRNRGKQGGGGRGHDRSLWLRKGSRTRGLELEQAGVAFDARYGVLTNDLLQTSNRRIYAVGDICTPFRFKHAADAMARIVIANALFSDQAKNVFPRYPFLQIYGSRDRSRGEYMALRRPTRDRPLLP
jgi:hypothetical protein